MSLSKLSSSSVHTPDIVRTLRTYIRNNFSQFQKKIGLGRMPIRISFVKHLDDAGADALYDADTCSAIIRFSVLDMAHWDEEMADVYMTHELLHIHARAFGSVRILNKVSEEVSILLTVAEEKMILGLESPIAILIKESLERDNKIVRK